MLRLLSAMPRGGFAEVWARQRVYSLSTEADRC